MNTEIQSKTSENQAHTKTGSKGLKWAYGAAAAAALALMPMAPAFAQGEHGGGGGHAGGGNHAAVGHAGVGHANAGRFNGGRGFAGRGGYYHGGFYGRGGWGYRPFGPGFAGFGFYYDSYYAWPFLGLAAWELADYSYLTEQQVRQQENAMATATTAPLNGSIAWNDGNVSGSVTPLRDGRTADGRNCREFQQRVTVNGEPQQAYGTACQGEDGSWQIVSQQ